MEFLGLKPCHFYLPSMTNGKFIPPIKMVMTGGYGLISGDGLYNSCFTSIHII